jgi:hypothetical protein
VKDNPIAMKNGIARKTSNRISAGNEKSHATRVSLRLVADDRDDLIEFAVISVPPYLVYQTLCESLM